MHLVPVDTILWRTSCLTLLTSVVPQVYPFISGASVYPCIGVAESEFVGLAAVRDHVAGPVAIVEGFATATALAIVDGFATAMALARDASNSESRRGEGVEH